MAVLTDEPEHTGGNEPVEETGWWNRPAGVREVLLVALPLMVSTSSWTLMQFIDRLYLMAYSSKAMAAALPSGMLSFVTVCVFLGIAAYVNTFVAQYYGAGHPERIGLAVWQGVWVGVAVIPMLLASVPLAPWIFALVDHDPQVQALEVTYYQIMCWGMGSLVAAAALEAFFTGRGQVRTVMAVDISAALVNVVLDYAWIFGRWGFAEGGITGAAWATVVAFWFKTVVYFALMLRPADRRKYHIWEGCRIDRALLARLIRFGYPNGVQLLLDAGGFTLFLFLIGRLGAAELTASNLALNINNVAFMPIWGLGIATTTLVGQRLGQDRADLAARATWSTFGISAIYSLGIGLLYVLAPDLFLYGFERGADPGEFAALRPVTVTLLWFVAAYLMFDAMNVVFCSAIKGAGDTRFVLFVSSSMSTVMVGLTWLGLEVCGWGLAWAWTTMLIWLFGLGGIYFARFVQGKWRRMRVIETAYLPGVH